MNTEQAGTVHQGDGVEGEGAPLRVGDGKGGVSERARVESRRVIIDLLERAMRKG